jgi:RNAse (barnase) inhibitor barstar
MTNKFALVDTESGLTIGRSLDLIGLTGNFIERVDDEDFNKITLVNFQYSDEFLALSKERKIYINNIDITILDDEENPIGSYYYVLKEPQWYDRSSELDQVLSKYELVGELYQLATEESLLVWDMRRKPLSKKNEWMRLSPKQRLAWLEVARLYPRNNPKSQDEQNAHYYLDATNLKDSTSFYCALGEAINGPGGYYGLNMDSLADCLCGGFGAIAPFVITIQNANLEMEESKYFFHKLKEVLTESNVTLIYS